MTLSVLIKKDGLCAIATAIPATAATDEDNKGGTVARIATIAVAEPPRIDVGQGRETDEVGQIVKAWRNIMGLNLDPDYVRANLDALKRWEHRGSKS
jgi:hypothetical protein